MKTWKHEAPTRSGVSEIQSTTPKYRIACAVITQHIQLKLFFVVPRKSHIHTVNRTEVHAEEVDEN